MEEWKTYLVEDLFEEIAMGPFGSNIKVDCFQPTGVPVLNGSNLFGYKLNEDSFNYVSTEKADSLGRSNAFRGDIVITHRGTLGQIVYIPENSKYDRYVISQSQFRLKLDTTKVLPSFFVYFFHTRLGQHRLLSNASQVGVPAIARPTSTFKKVEIELPSISLQQRIVDILDSIGNKIELNNRINHNLEEQAQALYKSWFVDFEPFKGGKFIQSRVGLIPETWAIQRICDLPLYISDYVSNGSFASLKENVTLYETPNYAQFIRNTDLKCRQFSVWVDQKSYEYLAKSKLEGGEIIISNVGDVGSVHICPQLNTPMTLGNNVIMIKPLDNIYKYFIYMTFKWFHGKDLIKGITGGSAMPKFNKSDFKSLNLLIPDYSTLCKFNSLVSNLFENTISLNSSNQRLSEIRDTLLPKLMSGELKINDLTC